jgi:hypothetical protein
MMWEYQNPLLRGAARDAVGACRGDGAQIATFTGHSLKDVEAILEAHDLGREPWRKPRSILSLPIWPSV